MTSGVSRISVTRKGKHLNHFRTLRQPDGTMTDTHERTFRTASEGSENRGTAVVRQGGRSERDGWPLTFTVVTFVI